MTPSSSSELTLSNVTLMTTGYLMCMVTGGDIPFREDSDTKHVTVAGEVQKYKREKLKILFSSSPHLKTRNKRSASRFLSRRFSHLELLNC